MRKLVRPYKNIDIQLEELNGLIRSSKSVLQHTTSIFSILTNTSVAVDPVVGSQDILISSHTGPVGVLSNTALASKAANLNLLYHFRNHELIKNHLPVVDTDHSGYAYNYQHELFHLTLENELFYADQPQLLLERQKNLNQQFWKTIRLLEKSGSLELINLASKLYSKIKVPINTLVSSCEAAWMLKLIRDNTTRLLKAALNLRSRFLELIVFTLRRDLRSAYRVIIHMLFKNMDDNSGSDDSLLQPSYQKQSFTFEFITHVKKRNHRIPAAAAA